MIGRGSKFVLVLIFEKVLLLLYFQGEKLQALKNGPVVNPNNPPMKRMEQNLRNFTSELTAIG